MVFAVVWGKVRREEESCDLNSEMGDGSCDLNSEMGDWSCDLNSEMGDRSCDLNSEKESISLLPRELVKPEPNKNETCTITESYLALSLF